MTPPGTIRVMTVDDHEILRGGLKFLLQAFEDIEWVGEARSGEQAISVCTQLQPDVILMDMKMSGMDGVTATRAIKQRCPNVQIIILTTFHETGQVQQALAAGAIGYLLKGIVMDDLANAIRAAYAGQPTLSTEATQTLIEVATGSPHQGHALTGRQTDVLALMVEGLGNNEIATRLTLSSHTVRNHVSEVLAKLGAANRAEAAVMAVQTGLVTAKRRA